MKSKFSSFFAALAAVFAFSAVGLAQDTKPTQETPPPPALDRNAEGRFGRGGEKMHGHRGEGRDGGMFRMFSELNLTETQKQQVNAIVETNKASSQANREEFKQLMTTQRSGTALTPEQQTRTNELKTQFRQSEMKMHSDLMAILNPEQQQQLKQKRDEMRQRFQERRQMKQQNGDTTQTPRSN